MKPGRVHPAEWLTGLLGLLLVVGLLLPWSGDEAALASPGFFEIVLLLIAVAAILLPPVVAASTRTDVPVVYETTLWSVSLLVGLALAVKAFFPPDAGFAGGFWLVLAGTLALGFTLWRNVARDR